MKNGDKISIANGSYKFEYLRNVDTSGSTDELSESARKSSFEADFFQNQREQADQNKNAQVWIVNLFLGKPGHNHLKRRNLMIQLGLEIPNLHQAKGKHLMKNLVTLTKKQDRIR